MVRHQISLVGGMVKSFPPSLPPSLCLPLPPSKHQQKLPLNRLMTSHCGVTTMPVQFQICAAEC